MSWPLNSQQYASIQSISGIPDQNFKAYADMQSLDPQIQEVEFQPPQSTPTKRHGIELLPPRQSVLFSAFRVSLSSPQQPTVRPQTRPSSSGIYLAQTPMWQVSDVSYVYSNTCILFTFHFHFTLLTLLFISNYKVLRPTFTFGWQQNIGDHNRRL